MNHYAPKQRKSDGMFDYTVTSDGLTLAVGYCAPYRPWTPKDQERFPVPLETIRGTMEHSHKHHDRGHATAEEAARCYHQYLLDHRLRLGLSQENRQEMCKECGVWTRLYAVLDNSKFVVLCSLHNNRETFERHCSPTAESWET